MLLILTLILVLSVLLGIPIWALVDAAGKPSEAFLKVGSSKGLWIALIAVFTICFVVVGLILAVIYLVSVRPKVDLQLVANKV